MKKKKHAYYVVWSGKKPGIYSEWSQCKEQTFMVPGSLYRGAPDIETAKRYLEEGPSPAHVAAMIKAVATKRQRTS